MRFPCAIGTCVSMTTNCPRSLLVGGGEGGVGSSLSTHSSLLTTTRGIIQPRKVILSHGVMHAGAL